jgi:hypothetical protein
LQANKEMMMKESKPYPIIEEEDGSCMTAQEPIGNAAYAYEEAVLPDEVAYAHIVDGVLQVTPDIEDEIAEVERGETVSVSEFKTMFAKWL